MTKQEHILKKIWKKPELRVLCRGESEENVLDVCKHGGAGHVSPGSANCKNGSIPCYEWAKS